VFAGLGEPCGYHEQVECGFGLMCPPTMPGQYYRVCMLSTYCQEPFMASLGKCGEYLFKQTCLSNPCCAWITGDGCKDKYEEDGMIACSQFESIDCKNTLGCEWDSVRFECRNYMMPYFSFVLQDPTDNTKLRTMWINLLIGASVLLSCVVGNRCYYCWKTRRRTASEALEDVLLDRGGSILDFESPVWGRNDRTIVV